MAHIGPAVRERRQRAGLSLLQLGVEANVDPGYLSRIERQEAGYSHETETKLARALGIGVAALHEASDGVLEAPESSFRRVPLIPLRQARAASQEAPPCFPEEALHAALPTELDVSRFSFAIRIQGNVMAPTFLEGDLVLIDPAVPPRAGDYVVARNGLGELVFNRYRVAGSNPADGSTVFELLAVNPYFPSWRSDQHPLEVIGVMVEHRIPRRL